MPHTASPPAHSLHMVTDDNTHSDTLLLVNLPERINRYLGLSSARPVRAV